MEKRTISDEMLERLILKGMMVDDYYLASLSTVFDSEYISDEYISKIFKFTVDHFKKYNKIPPRDIVIKSLEKEDKIKEIFEEVDAIEYDVATNFDYLFDETDLYLREQAFKDALLKGVDLIEKKENPLHYKKTVEDSLTKTLKIDLGVNYFSDMQKRLKKILSQTDIRIPSCYPILDEFISGGFPVYTLSVFLSRIHGYKTNILVNMASRQVLEGYSPLILSLEMSEDALCQRFDSIYSLLDINRIYLHKSFTQKMIKSLKDIKSKEGVGNLIIKEFPTGKGTVSDFKAFIRELKYRGIFPNPIYCDYLQLVKNEISKNRRQDEDISEIASALRAMSLEMQTPVISVSQLNREGMFTSFDDIDFTYVAKGIDISSVADFMAIFGRDEESLIYESELHYKIVKNRLGGRIGEIAKFFVDKRNLKMYDQTELDQWIEDAKISGDTRKVKEKN